MGRFALYSASRNARFWTFYQGSPVKLTIAPGDRLDHVHSERHDEGYETAWRSWEYEDGAITFDYAIHGSDCDGRYSRADIMVCSIDELAAYPAREETTADHPEVIGFPNWTDRLSEQRDYTAESMGY